MKHRRAGNIVKKNFTNARKKKRTKISLKKEIQNVLAGEKQKKHTQFENAFAVTDSTTGLNAIVAYPGQGVQAYGFEEGESSTEAQRIGNKINQEVLDFNYMVQLGSGVFGTDTENVLRVTIFEWLMDLSSEMPTFGDVFVESTTSFPYLSPFNIDTKQKYRILYDKVHNLCNTGGNPFIETVFLKLTNMMKMVKFVGDSQTGTGAGLIKGNLFFFTSSDSSASPHPTLTFSSMYTYTDF